MYSSLTHTSRYRKLTPLLFVLLAVLAVYGPTLRWLFDRWMLGVWYNAHGLLVPFISGYMIWMRLRSSATINPLNSSGTGLIFLVGALLLHVVDTVMWTQILSALSIVPAMIGLSLIFFGSAATRSIWLPLLLLVFMVPIPSAFLQPIVNFMRSITAAGASIVLNLIGVPLFHTGTYIEIPNAVINVAHACSGFATFSATLAFTALLLWLYPMKLKAMGLLLLTVLPVALTANIIRNVFLIMLTLNYGLQILDTFWHPLSGYIMYIIAIGIQLVIYNVTLKTPAEK